MPKRVKKFIKIKPKSESKSRSVFFSIKSNKKNKNIFNSKYDILSLLSKKIEFKKLDSFMKKTAEDVNIGFEKLKKSKGFRYYLYNIKHYFRKVVIENLLNIASSILNLFKSFIKTLERVSQKNTNIFSRSNNLNTKSFFKRLKYFFTPDSKSNWIGDFKRFVSLALAVVFIINVIFFSDQISNDLSKIVSTTVYAEDQIISAVNDVKSLNTELAGNKLYLALSSFYNLNDDLSFITKGAFNVVGKFANIQSKDLENILNNLENISQLSLKLVDEVDSNNDKNFLFKIQKANEFLLSINKNIGNINSIISSIDTTFLPEKYKVKLNELKQKVAFINDNSNKALQASYLMRDVLGENGKKRYLLVFQNSNEIRATGGFMGSYALIDVKDGNIVKTEVPGGGTYDLQGGFYKNIEPPMPLKLLVKKWEIQDANWFLDFPKSAKKISEFFEQSRNGSSVDGVIAINSNILKGLLELTGDISLPKYNIVISKDNVVSEIQDVISSKRLKTAKPKEIIGDLFAEINNKLFVVNGDNILKSISSINDSIGKKEILAYFQNSGDQNIAKFLGFSGDIKQSPQDYLSIVDTNIGGGKTSQKVSRSVKQSIKILSTGEVISSLNIHREMLSEENIDRNIEFTRIYVPEGSELLSVSGFSEDVKIKNYIDINQTQDKDLDNINKYSIKDENSNTIIYNDEGKTVFGNFIYLDKNDKKDINIVYKLPFKVDYDKVKNNKDSYYLYIQSQPGIEGVDFNVNIKASENNIYSGSFILNSDKYIEVNK